MIGLFHAAPGVLPAHQLVDIGILRQQHDAEGIAVQTADGMHRTALAGSFVISREVICQRPFITGK